MAHVSGKPVTPVTVPRMRAAGTTGQRRRSRVLVPGFFSWGWVMKYVVFAAGGSEHPVLFPRELSHLYVAELFAPMAVVAAGFVHEGDEGLHCGGESATLRVGCRGSRDAALIRASLGGG